MKNEKHVIIDLPLPFSSSEYLDLIQLAQIARKFIQDGATFVHNQGIEEFLEQITTKERFGSIKNINATFFVHSSDTTTTTRINQYIYLDNNHKYGCIGVLGWICVRMGILIYTRAGHGTIKSAQVIWNEQNEQGIPVDACCVVTFDQVSFWIDKFSTLFQMETSLLFFLKKIIVEIMFDCMLLLSLDCDVCM